MRSDQYIAAVVAKTETLTQTGLWSGAPKIKVEGWLRNFEAPDQVTAAVLLDHFVYFSAKAVEVMLRSAYFQMRNRLFAAIGAASEAYFQNAIFTTVEGERPNLTDSGNYMCRLLRQALGLPDTAFFRPEDALREASAGRCVIFVDDFLGSGSQFESTWRRVHPHPAHSFAQLFDNQNIRCQYLVIAATSRGVQHVSGLADGLCVTAGHLLDDRLSVTSLPWNPLKPDNYSFREELPAFLERYVPRLRVAEYLDDLKFRNYGYGELGLSLAFEHSVPDATLPLFWAEGSDGWIPLVRRS